MDKLHEKAMLDLQRLIKTQDFKTIEDMQAFMEKHVVNQPLPSFEKEALSLEEEAQNLIYQAAQEENLIEADRLIFQALALDIECVEAYELMGELSVGPMRSLFFFNNACAVARKKLGEEYFKETKGHFWGFHETRPYMRCLKHSSDCLYILDQKEEALSILFELLELNPNDNQGVRDQAGLYCLELGKLDRFEALHEEYKSDIGAFHHFNYALFCFIKNGDVDISRLALTTAREKNKHVFNLMISKKELPEPADHYGIGDKNEAVYYCLHAKDIWHNINGAMSWLEKIYYKR